MAPRINLPPFTRGLLLVSLVLCALNAGLRTAKWTDSLEETPSAISASNYLSSPEWAIPYLVLIPVQSVRYPWTVLTAALIENNIVSLAISCVVIWFGGRYLERAWGSKEFGKFVLIVTMIPNIAAFSVYAVWQTVTGVSTPHPTPLNGFVALEAAFLVSLKQLVPEHNVTFFKGIIRMRMKHFPAMFVLANMLSGPLFGTDTALWLSLFGFITSWTYLRFYQITEITSATTGGEGPAMRGDASDTFAFVAFFPDVIHPILSPLCDAIYLVLVAARICTPFSNEAIEAGNENAASRSEGGLPNIMNSAGGGGRGRRAEAERRRAVALKALDQRLNAAATNRATGEPVTNVQVSLNGDAPSSTVIPPEETSVPSTAKEAEA